MQSKKIVISQPIITRFFSASLISINLSNNVQANYTVHMLMMLSKYRPAMSANFNKLRAALVRCVLAVIMTYRYFISPLLGYHCRFYPSCSCYAEQAIHTHGLWRGLALALRRICKCHPWHTGGVDLVPEKNIVHYHCSHF